MRTHFSADICASFTAVSVNPAENRFFLLLRLAPSPFSSSTSFPHILLLLPLVRFPLYSSFNEYFFLCAFVLCVPTLPPPTTPIYHPRLTFLTPVPLSPSNLLLVLVGYVERIVLTRARQETGNSGNVVISSSFSRFSSSPLWRLPVSEENARRTAPP